MTHDERNFPDPYEFNPERWLSPDGPDILEASQPFSLGSRGCLGKKCVPRSILCAALTNSPFLVLSFAYVEVNLILAKMHLAYDLELVDETLDWLASGRLHYNWAKPELNVRFKRASK